MACRVVLTPGAGFSDLFPTFDGICTAAASNGARQDVAMRFSGFELDRSRGEVRGPDGEVLQLRPKAFSMLVLFAVNAGRLLSKDELMEAVWPGVHVAEDSLFKCIREIRTALGDDQREMIKLISGRGYLFDAEVSAGKPAGARQSTTGQAPANPAWAGADHGLAALAASS